MKRELCPLCRRPLDPKKTQEVKCELKQKDGSIKRWTEAHTPCDYCECILVAPSIGERGVDFKFKDLKAATAQKAAARN